MRDSAAGSTSPPAALADVLGRVAVRAERAGVFGAVKASSERLACEAAASAEPAWYQLAWADGALWVSLVTADRWLSESIEADLMHTGDTLEELLEEELVDLGYQGPGPTFQHYRSDDMLFTFRTPVYLPDGIEAPSAAEAAAIHLLGYEACFRGLGDMDADASED